MCGIAGCLAIAFEADPDQHWVARATERIHHRGPDDEGFYTDRDVALGYKRLAIIDLSPGGHQPMRSADGRYWMVYNGEIYNYLELGQELREQGVVLRTSSDSEVLLETYARVGKEVVHRLRGMFAFAIWDTWTRELFCARDPFGIKPFYYRVDSGPVGHAPWLSGPADPGPQPSGDSPWLSAPPVDPGLQPSGDSPWLSAPPADPGSQLSGGSPWLSAPPVDPGRPAGEGRHRGRHAAPGGEDRTGAEEEQEPADWFAPTPPRGGGAGKHAAAHSGPLEAAMPYDASQAGPVPGNTPVAGSAPGQGSAQFPGYTQFAGDVQFAESSPFPGTAPFAESSPAPGGAHFQGGPQAPGALFPGTAPFPGGSPLPGGSSSAPLPQPAGGQAAPVSDGMAGGQAGMERMFRFASERKALADPGEIHALDTGSLRRYLSFQFVPPPETLTPPIRVLPPGHALIARPGRSVDVFRYWRADLSPARAPSDSSASEILAAMRDSVAVHLRSDAPLGAFLSGGIDSAAICALAAEHRPDLLTFTVGFEREGYSEIDRAQETAAALGVKSIPYVISPEEFFHYLPQIIWNLDDPMADAAAVPLWFVAREAAKHVKVVLSGEGSDELFGGYAIYHQPGVVRAGERLPGVGRVPIQKAASMIPAGVRGKGLLERISTPLRRRYIGNAHVFIGDQVDLVARPGPEGPFEVTDPIYDQAEEHSLDDVSTMQLVDINTWLPGDILVKADRMTMAHSLELRVPFLDREVMAVAARLAREEKIGAGTTKVTLRAAMSGILPKAAAERAKLGFPVPIGHWLRGDAYEYAHHVLSEAQTGEWINREAAMGLLERFRAGDAEVSWRHVWVLIVFSLWHQIYVEHRYDPLALGWERPARMAR